MVTTLKRWGHRSHVSGMKRMIKTKAMKRFVEQDEKRLQRKYVRK